MKDNSYEGQHSIYRVSEIKYYQFRFLLYRKMYSWEHAILYICITFFFRLLRAFNKSWQSFLFSQGRTSDLIVLTFHAIFMGCLHSGFLLLFEGSFSSKKSRKHSSMYHLAGNSGGQVRCFVFAKKKEIGEVVVELKYPCNVAGKVE